jgi:hypothetical protein
MNESQHTDELEQYLQQHAGEHRMYPSDHVWKNIRKKIHTPKKWPALSVFTVLIISALVVGTVLNKPHPDTATPNIIFSLQSPANSSSEKKNSNIKNAQQQLVDELYSIDQLTSRTITAAVEKIKIDNTAGIQLAQTDKDLSKGNLVTSLTGYVNLAEANTNKPYADKNTLVASAEVINSQSSSTFRNLNYYLFDIASRIRSILNSEPPATNVKTGAAFFTSRNHEIAFNDLDLKVQHSRTDILPSALEKLSKSSSRFDFRFYITPSISYRRLVEEKTQNASGKNAGVSLESNYKIDPSQAINHRPAIGYETGVGLGYKLNKKFTLTGGFQFNISQYRINAFLHKDEPAAVTLGEGNFSSTVNTVSSLRSIPGSQPLTIKNRYYQISMPLGVDWQAWRSKKLNWGIAGSIQPTYTFDKQPLIITSNYKNYADGSVYVRNWNLNANVETYIGYTKGSYRWQIGPQLRYQMLPSLVDKYPNKEYLVNYGIKVGVVKKLK